MVSKTFINTFVFLGCAVLRGTTPLVLKQGIKELDETFIVVARSLPVVMIFATHIYIMARLDPVYKKHTLKSLNHLGTYKRAAVMGWQTAAPFVLFGFGSHYVAASVLSVLYALAPILASLIGTMKIWKHRTVVGAPQFIAVVVAVAGVVCIVLHSFLDIRNETGPKIILGIVLELLGVIAIAILAVVWKNFNSKARVGFWFRVERWKAAGCDPEEVDKIISEYIDDPKKLELPEEMREKILTSTALRGKENTMQVHVPLIAEDLFEEATNKVFEAGDVHYLVGAMGQSFCAFIYASYIGLVTPNYLRLDATSGDADIDWKGFLVLLYFAVGSGYLVVLSLFYLYDAIGPVKTQRMLYLVPVVGIIEDAIFLDAYSGQSAGFIILSIVGILLVLTALWINSKKTWNELKGAVLSLCGQGSASKESNEAHTEIPELSEQLLSEEKYNEDGIPPAHSKC